jgi:hypothetical protein
MARTSSSKWKVTGPLRKGGRRVRPAAEHIAKVSPEGRPAYPSLRGRHFAGIIGIAFAVTALMGGVVAFMLGAPSTALGAILLGSAVFLVANPVTWAAAARAAERREADEAPIRPGDDARSLQVRT